MKNYRYSSIQKLNKNERLTKKEAWDFWKNPKEIKYAKNAPFNYIQYTERSKYLTNLIKKYLEQDSNILEIGCNVGRNLNDLYENNFKNLSGVEISNSAIELMKDTFSDLYKKANIYVSPIEDWLENNDKKNFDLIYSMAVFEHIHWDSNFIFDIIKKIASKYIITIEDETTNWSNRHFPRNYKEIFEDQNWAQIFSINCSEVNILDDRFFVRVFEKKN